MFGSIFADADVGSGQFQTTAHGGAGAELGYGPTSGDGGATHSLWPDTGFSWAFWLGVSGLVFMVVIRHSLPN